MSGGVTPPRHLSKLTLTLVLLNGFPILDPQNEALGVSCPFLDPRTDNFVGEKVFVRSNPRVAFPNSAFPLKMHWSLASSLSPIPLTGLITILDIFIVQSHP